MDRRSLASAVLPTSLEDHLQSKFQGARRAQAEHARADADPVGGALGCSGAIDRARTRVPEGIQDWRERIRWAIEVSKVGHIEERDAGRDGEALLDLALPAETDVQGAQPSQVDLSRGRGLNRLLDSFQQSQL